MPTSPRRIHPRHAGTPIGALATAICRARLFLVILGSLAGAGLAASPALATTTTFTATGAEQTFVVPAGVSSLQVTAVGAPGGADPDGAVLGGLGATVGATVPVNPGEILYVEVGSDGGRGLSRSATAGGFNGGGAGAGGGGGGGGASDLRTAPGSNVGSLATRLVVAGGGGGAGDRFEGGAGAEGGGAAGQSGGSELPYCGPGRYNGCGGHGATASAGGSGGAGGESAAGGAGISGAGGSGQASSFPAEPGGGGGGGGGLFGGGGGGAALTNGGGGGGGSSGFAAGAAGTSVGLDTTGVPSVTLTYPGPTSAPPVAPAPILPPVAPVAPPVTPAKSCLVPKLVGKTLKDARKALARADCTLGHLGGRKEKGARVKSQSPAKGRSLPGGSKVNVTLTPGKEPPRGRPPRGG